MVVAMVWVSTMAELAEKMAERVGVTRAAELGAEVMARAGEAMEMERRAAPMAAVAMAMGAIAVAAAAPMAAVAMAMGAMAVAGRGVGGWVAATTAAGWVAAERVVAKWVVARVGLTAAAPLAAAAPMAAVYSHNKGRASRHWHTTGIHRTSKTCTNFRTELWALRACSASDRLPSAR